MNMTQQKIAPPKILSELETQVLINLLDQGHTVVSVSKSRGGARIDIRPAKEIKGAVVYMTRPFAYGREKIMQLMQDGVMITWSEFETLKH